MLGYLSIFISFIGYYTIYKKSIKELACLRIFNILQFCSRVVFVLTYTSYSNKTRTIKVYCFTAIGLVCDINIVKILDIAILKIHNSISNNHYRMNIDDINNFVFTNDEIHPDLHLETFNEPNRDSAIVEDTFEVHDEVIIDDRDYDV